MNAEIEAQKTIANTLIHKLEAVDPHVILAGGAPRSWFLGQEARDLDFYVYLPEGAACHEQRRWQSLGLKLDVMEVSETFGNSDAKAPELSAKEAVGLILNSSRGSLFDDASILFDSETVLWQKQQYNSMEHLTRVWTGEYNGIPYQIMVMSGPTFQTVIPHFGTSVCMAWYKYRCHYTFEFLLSMHLEIIFKRDDYTAKTAHVEKMIKYFPEFDVKDYCDLETEAHMNGYSTDYKYSTMKLLKKELRLKGHVL